MNNLKNIKEQVYELLQDSYDLQELNDLFIEVYNDKMSYNPLNQFLKAHNLHINDVDLDSDLLDMMQNMIDLFINLLILEANETNNI